MFNAANMQGAPLALCSIDQAGRVQFANAAFELLVGAVEIGTHVHDILIGEGLGVLPELSEVPLAQPYVMKVTTTDDPSLQFQAVFHPVADGESLLLQLIKTTTGQHISGVGLNLQDNDRRDFLAAISHQIRSPVSGVLGIAELLSETRLSTEQAKYVDMLARSGHALIQLVNEIQEIALLEQGTATVSDDMVDVRVLVTDAMDLFSVPVSQKGIAAVADIAADVPAVVMTDRSKLHQILVNLLGSAFQHAEQDQIAISLSMDSTGGAEQLVIKVRNMGTGAKKRTSRQGADTADTVGQEQQKKHAQTQKYSNTDLGLMICRKFAHLMNGALEVEGEPGLGTSICVTLPVTPVAISSHDKEAALRGSRVEDADTHVDNGPWHLLVTEDNPVNQMLFKKMLERAGHRVMVAANGQEAVAKVQLGNRFDAILMDISMPVMDGLEATAMIRSLYGPAGATPILALTAHAMDGDREKFLNAGMDGYQSKPVDPVTLEKAIAAIIRDRLSVDGLDTPLGHEDDRHTKRMGKAVGNAADNQVGDP